MMRQEHERETGSAKTSQLTKCLQAVIDHQDKFDSKNISKYLRIYWQKIMLNDLNEEISIAKFPSLVELEIRKVVEKLVTTLYDRTGKQFMQGIKEEYMLQHANHVTHALFLDRIYDRTKALGPQELFKEFNRRCRQLSLAEAKVISFQKEHYFLGFVDTRLREKLEYALDLLHPLCDGITTWPEIEKEIDLMSQGRRQRELDNEVILRIS